MYYARESRIREGDKRCALVRNEARKVTLITPQWHSKLRYNYRCSGRGNNPSCPSLKCQVAGDSSSTPQDDNEDVLEYTNLRLLVLGTRRIHRERI